MDETITQPQGAPQSARAGLSSSGETGTTPPSEKTFTEAEHRKAISDLKAEQGRKEKELTRSLKEAQVARASLEQSHNSLSSRLEALEATKREAELEQVRDNPDLLKQYQDRESLTKRVRQLEQEKRDMVQAVARATEIENEYQETKKGILISQIAGKVTPEKLERLRGLSIEALEIMIDVTGKAPTPTTPGAPEFTPDSAISSGGVGEITPEWAENASMEEYATRRNKQKASL